MADSHQPATGSEPGRTPDASLRDVFRDAALAFPSEGERAEVVGEALDFLQRGFEVHYRDAEVTDDSVLVGDNDYAWAVETIARLDEPRFVAVASRMIRDGAGRISSGGRVTLDFWTPHLADLLSVLSGEAHEKSRARIEAASGRSRPRG